MSVIELLELATNKVKQDTSLTIQPKSMVQIVGHIDFVKPGFITQFNPKGDQTSVLPRILISAPCFPRQGIKMVCDLTIKILSKEYNMLTEIGDRLLFLFYKPYAMPEAQKKVDYSLESQELLNKFNLETMRIGLISIQKDVIDGYDPDKEVYARLLEIRYEYVSRE